MEKKKNKGLIATLVILIVLLLGLGIYTAYDKLVLDKNTRNDLEASREDLEIANREKKEANDKVKDLEKNIKETVNVEENNYIVSTYKDNTIHIYAVGYGYTIYSYNNNTYIASTIDKSLNLDECTGIENILSSSNPGKSGDGYKLKSLNISEKDLNKIRVKTVYNESDAISLFYIIKNDGTVTKNTLSDSGLNNMTSKTVLSNYKVNDIEITCNSGSIECDNPTYKLTLLDGTSKTVTEK